MGLRHAIVDPDFPLAVADRLRADGVTLTPEHDTFASRRRAKSAAELAGIRRAQKDGHEVLTDYPYNLKP
jgi:Xaa-Pro aminopeptidase